mmetsp:Transcript_66541/g.124136  ORF Transcript_66541/g.124136 Transcript_66541/m.124136 type:complete len:527 (-) Transcript_66541:89-1669(-)
MPASPTKVVVAQQADASREASSSPCTKEVPSSGGEHADEVAICALKYAIPIKNILSCYLLGPVLFGECKSDRFCEPLANLALLVLDITAFSGHLLLGLRRRSYRQHVPTYNFYILLVFWSIWNLCSHPLCRQHVVDLFVMPPEIHVMINIIAIGVCSSKIMAPPSMRHLIGLVTLEFLISLLLSWVEVMNFSIDSGWLAVARLDIVMFNVTILLIGSTILLGTMTVEKDIKTLASDLEHRLGSSGYFEDDLERRKRAVLTALCDAVLTTNSSFVVSGTDEGADRLFRRSMLNETFTDYFKDESEKEKFLAAVKRQFPDDDSVGEGPKRMRVTLHDVNGDPFEADVVVSDASIDPDGKVNKFMVGMHARDHRSRVQDTRTKAKADKGTKTALPHDADKKNDASAGMLTRASGEDRAHAMYEELTQELLAVFEATLRPQPECSDSISAGRPPGGGPHGANRKDSPDGKRSSNLDMSGFMGSHEPPRIILRRASCEVFRRRASPLVSRTGDRHVDLRRLTLPEPAGGIT